jgi:hypothetical protein
VTYIFIAIAPTILFWFLDAYYLQQEKKFRGLFDDVVALRVPNFAMSKENYVGGDYRLSKSFLSPTIYCLYGFIGLGLLAGGIILQFVDCCKVIHCCH